MMDDHPSWLSVGGSVQVEPQGLNEFAERVMGELLSTFADSRSRVDPMLTESLTVPFGGGGLLEGEAFAQAHMLNVMALGDFLNDVSSGLLTLGMGASNICLEYQGTDAESAATIETVERMFAPDAQHKAETAAEVEAWARATYDSHRPDAVDGWAVNMAAERAEGAQPSDDERFGPAFQDRVQERLEHIRDNGTDSVGSGGMGDLGAGQEARDVLGGPDQDHPEVLHVTPADTERVAETPPESLAAAMEAERRDG